MTLQEGKDQFISEWGCLCMNWGVNRTMGQIHGLLLISKNDLSSEEIMDALKLSRGNVNMNVRALIDWGIVHKVLKPGHRMEFFRAEKDIWKILCQIIKHRKKKELDPLLSLLDRMAELPVKCTDSDEFCRQMKELRSFSKKAEKSLSMLTSTDNNWLTGPLFNMISR